MKMFNNNRIFKDKGTYDDRHLYKGVGVLKRKPKNDDYLYDYDFMSDVDKGVGVQDYNFSYGNTPNTSDSTHDPTAKASREAGQAQPYTDQPRVNAAVTVGGKNPAQESERPPADMKMDPDGKSSARESERPLANMKMDPDGKSPALESFGLTENVAVTMGGAVPVRTPKEQVKASERALQASAGSVPVPAGSLQIQTAQEQTAAKQSRRTKIPSYRVKAMLAEAESRSMAVEPDQSTKATKKFAEPVSGSAISHEPEPEETIAAAETVKPEPEVTIAAAEAVKPEPEVTIAAAEAVKPEPEVTIAMAEAVKPEPEVTIAAAEAVKPEPEEMLAAAEAVKPEPEVTIAAAEAVMPEAEVMKTAAEAVKPEAEETITAAEATKPEVKETPATTEAARPEAEKMAVEAEIIDTNREIEIPKRSNVLKPNFKKKRFIDIPSYLDPAIIEAFNLDVPMHQPKEILSNTAVVVKNLFSEPITSSKTPESEETLGQGILSEEVPAPDRLLAEALETHVPGIRSEEVIASDSQPVESEVTLASEDQSTEAKVPGTDSHSEEYEEFIEEGKPGQDQEAAVNPSVQTVKPAAAYSDNSETEIRKRRAKMKTRQRLANIGIVAAILVIVALIAGYIIVVVRPVSVETAQVQRGITSEATYEIAVEYNTCFYRSMC